MPLSILVQLAPNFAYTLATLVHHPTYDLCAAAF